MSPPVPYEVEVPSKPEVTSERPEVAQLLHEELETVDEEPVPWEVVHLCPSRLVARERDRLLDLREPPS